MAYTQTYNFPFAKKGDSYNEVEFTVLLNNVAVDLTDCVIKMWLVDNKIKSGCVNPNKIEYTTINQKFTITAPILGKFRTNFGIVNIQEGVYNYDIEIKFPNGTIKTWIKGIFSVDDDITK